MASIVIAGDTSGSVTISAPAIAGTPTLTLPTTSGTLVVTGGAQTVQFAAGSAAAPSITFTGDTNTGIFSPAADTIAFTEGGVESMRIDSSGNVGIGTSSPFGTAANRTVLSVNGTTDSMVNLGVNGTRTANFYTGSTITVIGSHTSIPLSFETGNTERMRISSGGSLLFGTTDSIANITSSSGTGLALYNSNGNTQFLGSNANDSVAQLNRQGNDGELIIFRKNGVSIGSVFGTTTGLTLTGTNGITFTATQTASADANTLDDYEEGTWTPVLDRATTSPSITYGVREGKYTKIGNMVTCWISINNITVSSAGSGSNIITGLPFAIGNATYAGSGGFGYNDAFTNTVYGAVLNNNETRIFFRSGTRSSGNDNGGWTSGGYLGLTFSYFVN